MDIDEFIKFVRRELVSATQIFRCLLAYSRTSQEDAIKLVHVLSRDELFSVLDFLGLYPETPFGWSVLPIKRCDFTRPDLDQQELFDLECQPFQEDEPYVSFLKTLVKDQLHQMEFGSSADFSG